MKRAVVLVSFIGLQAVLALVLIYKESEYIKPLYQQQRFEKKLQELQSTRQALSHKLQKLQGHSAIRTYAREKLHMTEIPLASLRTLNGNESTQS